MNFRQDLAELVMAGEKTVTRRLASTNPRSPWWKGGCKLKPGRDYAVCPGRGKTQIGRVVVTATELMPLGRLSDQEARREGFPDRLRFELAFCGVNGLSSPVAYDPEALVWRVEFEVFR